ncbi:MAG: RNA polymerase factor sigma-54 [Candidatus Omnitrophota bacterium]|jgi:RNA polymerase sigma-54 factor
MELRQRFEFRRVLAPEMRQSLNILTLHLLDLNQVVEEELLTNPVLEEFSSQEEITSPLSPEDLARLNSPPSLPNNTQTQDNETNTSLLMNKVSLQDVLLRQLGMFTNSDEELKIGQEIIGNIDENGYLQSSTEGMAVQIHASEAKIEKVLSLIQQFEPSGVGARTISECLLIQLKLLNELDPLTKAICLHHLDDIAKKNYNHISKVLKEPLEKIEVSIKKIMKLNPKPGRNYSLDEAHRIVPDILIEEKSDGFEIIINHEYIPRLTVSKLYKDLLKKEDLDPKTREFITNKLRKALELIKAIEKRKSTLRRVVNTITEIQGEAIREDLSQMKPLTFKEIADKLDLHESTVCRVVMNKYAKTPCGVIALKNFFSSHIHHKNGESISSTVVKSRIKELIDKENKKQPLSDQDIVKILSSEDNLNLARRTVAKYREELKILSSTFRKER